MSWTADNAKIDEGKSYILKTILKSNDIILLNSAAQAYEAKKEFDSALWCLKKSLRSDPNNYITHYLKGRALESLCLEDKAINSYGKAIQINPMYERAYMGLVTAYFNSDDDEKALHFCDVALEINPKNVHAMSWKGVINLYAENYDEAIVWLNKTLEYEPGFSYALQCKRKAMRRKDRQVYEVIHVQDHFFELNPQDIEVYDADDEFVGTLEHFNSEISEDIEEFLHGNQDTTCQVIRLGQQQKFFAKLNQQLEGTYLDCDFVFVADQVEEQPPKKKRRLQ
jgi:tetratricopeptide (TPR) repeat protein